MAKLDLSTRRNMAGEPAADITVNGVTADMAKPLTETARDDMRQLGAACRAVMMAGALESALALSVQYAMDRTQFGRPLAKFQAIQQQLAQLAGEVAACMRAAESLVGLTALNVTDVAIAKARVGEAVQLATDVSHQVHGAIGYTREHQLNHRTRRLWMWRDEYGAEKYWQGRLGALAIKGGADGVWPFITAA